MSDRSGHLIRAVADALIAQSAALDAMRGVTQVTIVVNYDPGREAIRRVIVRPELVSDRPKNVIHAYDATGREVRP